MKVLIDEWAPKALKLSIAAYAMNASPCKIAVVILHGRTNRLEDLIQQFTACVAALRNIKSGDIVHLGDAAK